MEEVREFVEIKLAKWGYSVEPLEMEMLMRSVSLLDGYTPAQAKTLAETVLTEIIPELLLLPDITEGGYSIKRDKTGITAYHLRHDLSR